jgi:hypothetical protein
MYLGLTNWKSKDKLKLAFSVFINNNGKIARTNVRFR